MAEIPRAQAPDGLKVGQVVQLSNGMPVSMYCTQVCDVWVQVTG